uniref:Heterogeneous nuclear ribonucleoprotein A1 n=1 Tax=Strongyloides papillosus TaxID=174720 RepID=A0A0N5BEK8_STREA
MSRVADVKVVSQITSGNTIRGMNNMPNSIQRDPFNRGGMGGSFRSPGGPMHPGVPNVVGMRNSYPRGNNLKTAI